MVGTFLIVFFCMALGGLVVQIIRAELLFYKVREVVTRAETVLGILEGHNVAREAAVDRVVQEVKEVKRNTVRAADLAAQARVTAAAAADQIPEKVVGLLKSSESGQEWRPGDPERRTNGGG